ncbi:rRNA maturation RNase YbeY [Polynucleobacter necessarius]|uniref:rRNA maturation RNase YbeY n=1 Tax=Polynucleobacter necessarius TaxID=576610 RepID=UPI000E093ED0|nr:rRNA maturation RNase YbeY [Polynucleobacter necessarius]
MPLIKTITPSKLAIDLQYASPAIEAAIGNIASATPIKRWVKNVTPLSGQMTLRFVNAAEGKKLHLAFRKKDYATNVLTFPYELSKNTLVADVIFCLPVIRREAKAQGKPLEAHLAHLIVHACLHAQGYDHEVSKDAKKMEALEIQILQKMGFANPYK